MKWYGEPFSRHYAVLGVLTFLLLFPGVIHVSESHWRMLLNTIVRWATLCLTLQLFGYATGYARFYDANLVVSWQLVTLFGLVFAQEAFRYVMLAAMEQLRRTAIIVGANDTGAELALRFKADKYAGIKFLGFFDDRTRDRLSTQMDNHQLLGATAELASYVKSQSVDHIYISLPMASQPRILALLNSLKDTTASVFFVPDMFVTDLIQGRVDQYGGMPVVAVCESPFTGLNGIIKQIEDIILSVLILILISPVLLACALAVRMSSPGPIIFKQLRYGLDSKKIFVYKFRSMTTQDNGEVVQQAKRNDVRITPVGAFLRRTSLDELPQFINVLQGRMSIVGPRPHAVAHNEQYRQLIKGYMVRHKVRPGITGLAQVAGARGETETLDKMERRIRLDLEYLRNWSLMLDLKIIIRTILVVLKDDTAY
nr:undecaprenyl-phosphate glucose phosphotransferase [Uliginosibacterium gangwonense]